MGIEKVTTSEDPSSARDFMAEDLGVRLIGSSYSGWEHGVGIEGVSSLKTLSEAAPGDIQKIAASQISLLVSYYNAVLAQATMSFKWALIAAGVGLAFFIAAIASLLITDALNVAIVSAIGGTLVEVISGINFLLYGKTTAQLSDFHKRLDQTQRFLLANSICESLEGNAKQRSRADLVSVVATLELKSPRLPKADSAASTKDH